MSLPGRRQVLGREDRPVVKVQSLRDLVKDTKRHNQRTQALLQLRDKKLGLEPNSRHSEHIMAENTGSPEPLSVSTPPEEIDDKVQSSGEATSSREGLDSTQGPSTPPREESQCSTLPDDSSSTASVGITTSGNHARPGENEAAEGGDQHAGRTEQGDRQPGNAREPSRPAGSHNRQGPEAGGTQSSGTNRDSKLENGRSIAESDSSSSEQRRPTTSSAAGPHSQSPESDFLKLGWKLMKAAEESLKKQGSHQLVFCSMNFNMRNLCTEGVTPHSRVYVEMSLLRSDSLQTICSCGFLKEWLCLSSHSSVMWPARELGKVQ